MGVAGSLRLRLCLLAVLLVPEARLIKARVPMVPRLDSSASKSFDLLSFTFRLFEFELSGFVLEVPL